MIKKLFIAMALLVGLQAQAAQDAGLELGVRQQAADVGGLNISANSQTGWQLGGFYHLPLEGGVAHWRTGLLYTRRPVQSENDITGETIDFTFDYLDIPFDLLFKPKENLGVYLGFHVSINVASDCSGDSNCKVSDVNTPLFPFVFGVMYKFTPKFGFNFYIDGSNTSIARGIGNFRAAGLNLTYSFE